MSLVNSKQFLQNSVAYEAWRAQLDPQLRDFTIWGGVSIVAMLAALSMFGGQLPPVVHTTLLWANAIGLVSFIVLLIATRGLQAGVAFWHKLARAQMVLGAVNVFTLSVALAILVVLAVVWFIVYVVLPIVAIMIFFSILAAGR